MGNKKIKLALLCLLWPGLGQAELAPQNWEQKPVCFGTAKSFLRKVYRENHWDRDFYCGCPLQASGKRLEAKNCLVQEADLTLTRQGAKTQQLYAGRALAVEWEHVVPASVLGDRDLTLKKAKEDCRAEQPLLPGTTESQYNQGILACAKKRYEDNKKIVTDPHNLYPVMGQLNALRGDKLMSAVSPGDEMFSLCQFSLDAAFVEPPQRIKGDVARIYYYMANKYPKKQAEILNSHVRSALLDWCKADPVSEEERKRVQAVAKATGVQNPFLEMSCDALAVKLYGPAPRSSSFPLPKTAQGPVPSASRPSLPASVKIPDPPRSNQATTPLSDSATAQLRLPGP